MDENVIRSYQQNRLPVVKESTLCIAHPTKYFVTIHEHEVNIHFLA